jgi:hypothetical protein
MSVIRVKAGRAPKVRRPNMSRAETLLDLYDVVKGLRSNFETYWQTLHDYFYIEGENVSTDYAEGAELTVDNLFDSSTIESADVLASGFMNYLTPPTTKWFNLTTRNIHNRDNKKVTDYLEDVRDELYYILNKSNFNNQMISCYKSSGVYGTSVILCEEDNEDIARFYALPIKQVVIVEDGRGRVCEYFIEFEYTAEQAAGRFGKEKLSTALKQELGEENRDERKHKFLLYISKRHVRDITKSDKRNLPVEASWIDAEGKSIIEEGGYNEFPAMCHRFDKRPFVPWGYSPAMKALPFARLLNAIAKTNLRAMMKRTDPPIAIPDNAFVMPFNANPRAINYYNKTKMDGKNDIFSFGEFGDPNVGMTAIEYYSQKLKALMFNDIFLQFNNITKQMNNPEVYEKINEKMSMLGPAVGRYIGEMINPTIIRLYGIAYRQGRLPQPPDEMLDDPTYEIDCVSQLAQAQRRSELNALTTGLNLVGQMAELVPDVLDKVSPDSVVKEVWSILGASTQVLRSDDEVAAMREARSQVAQQQQAMNLAEQGSKTVANASKVDLNTAKANENKK